MSDLKFLTKSKIIQQCTLPFTSVRVIMDSTTAFKTLYGYNTRVLMLIYIKDNKPIHFIKTEDSTFSLNKVSKYQFVQVEITKE